MELESNNDYEIQRHVEKLDQEAMRYDAKWGVNLLPTLVSPEMASKWRVQCEKLDDAIRRRDLDQVADLVNGSIRGYRALDAAAVSLGCVPNPPTVWDAVHPDSGRKYRIAVNEYDARKATEKDVVVYSLEEVVRILETKQLINVVKDHFPGAKVEKVTPFDFKKGDSVEFN